MHALAHRNVLAFHAWYETSNHLWLVLEYAAGGDVRALLAADGCCYGGSGGGSGSNLSSSPSSSSPPRLALPESSAHDLGAGVAKGLLALHAAGGLHCDLKPSNVLLDEGGSPKLAGFGLSKRPGSSSSSDKSRKESSPPPPASFVGSPAYLAPELFLGGKASIASDLYSLGCFLFELMTGAPPFVLESVAAAAAEEEEEEEERKRRGGLGGHGDGDEGHYSMSLAALVERILSPSLPAPPLPASVASAAAADLVSRLLSKDPGSRPSWEEVAAHPWWKRPLARPAADGAEEEGGAC